MKCNCHSYNLEIGKDEEVISKGICLDACIADTISKLWEVNISTISSCCGHGLKSPSVVLSEDQCMRECYNELKNIDARDWEISRWERIIFRGTR